MQRDTPDRSSQPVPFQLSFIEPYSTYNPDGTPNPVPYLLDGLLTEGGFSTLNAKPKQGKSTFARALAVAVTKGEPFLGRATARGGCILISLEDPLIHIDNCLQALGYDPAKDCRIHIAQRVAPSVPDTLAALRRSLEEHPDVRLVIIDPLAKLLKLSDLSDYMPTLSAVEQLRNVARDFPRVHILALIHAKKTATADAFDGILGSTALRGEADTNLVIYECDGRRILASETRIGRALAPTMLEAELVDVGGSNVPSGFYLGEALADAQVVDAEKSKHRKTVWHESSILDHLHASGGTALQKDVLAVVPGRRESNLDTIRKMVVEGILTASESSPRSLQIAVDPDALKLLQIANKAR